MNIELLIKFSSIGLLGLFLFWLIYRNSDNTKKLAENYLLKNLRDTSLTQKQRNEYEKQLSSLLQKNQKSSNSFKIVVLIAVYILPLSLYFYSQLGDPTAIDYINITSNKNMDSNGKPQLSMQDAIDQLEKRIAKEPNNVDAQMLYARSQVSLKNYSKAVSAYRKARELVPNEPVILIEMSEAIALSNNNHSFLGEPEKLLTQAYQLDQTNQKGLWLLGMTFYEHQNYKKTNELWSKLYDIMTDEAAKKQLAHQLNDIREKLGLVPISSETKQTTSIANNSTLNIKINLTDNLKENLKGKRALLYVYTKAPTGIPMPIAVIKLPLEQIVKGFPIDLTMNDSNSLQPTRKLSDFKQIKIGARISFTGNALPQAGDLQSDEFIIDLPNSETIELIIDKVR